MKLLYTRNLQEESYALDLYGRPFKKEPDLKPTKKNIKRLSILWRIMEIEITPSEISIILHMIRKPNSITALLINRGNRVTIVPEAEANPD